LSTLLDESDCANRIILADIHGLAAGLLRQVQKAHESANSSVDQLIIRTSSGRHQASLRPGQRRQIRIAAWEI
jgi:hypothetical protein